LLFMSPRFVGQGGKQKRRRQRRMDMFRGRIL
jgi:hypothetical protein